MTERVLGPTGSPRRRRRVLWLTVITAIVFAALFVTASSGTLSGGSTFESGDGDLAAGTSTPPATHDWNFPVEPITCGSTYPSTGTNCGLDLYRDIDPTHQDDALGQGAKEDDPVPTVVQGSIPPSKDDLTRFYVNKERAGGNDYLYLAWERSNLLGSAHMDFEFNQDSTLSANGVTPVRTAGDLLIDFDFGGSGVPVLVKHTWITSGTPSTDCEASNTLPCWDKAVPLGSFAEAQVNSTGVVDTNPPDAPRTLPGNTKNGINSTFGEAGINLTGSGIFPQGTCKHFGAAYLKSRSSGNSFSSELKDFIAPIPVNITNCGTVNIHKQDDAGAPLAGAVFTLYTDNAPLDGNPPRGAEDIATSLTCTTDSSGDCSIANVPFGNYWAVETTGVSGYDLAPDQSFSLGANTPNLTISLTFVDPLQKGALKVVKTAKNKNCTGPGTPLNYTAPNGVCVGDGQQSLSGVSFTITKGAFSATQSTDANGVACFTNLTQGTYSVAETVPSNYHAVTPNPHDATVGASSTPGSCTTGSPTVDNVSNIPLSSIEVKFTSLAGTGVTALTSTTTCVGTVTGSASGTGSDDRTFTNLEPDTYTCTVVIDP